MIRVMLTAKDGEKYFIKKNKCQKMDNIRLANRALLHKSCRITGITIHDEC
jgi:hypothetical protein